MSEADKIKVRAIQSNFAQLLVSLRGMNAQVQHLTNQQTSDSILLATLNQIDEDLGKFVDASYAIRAVVEESLQASGA